MNKIRLDKVNKNLVTDLRVRLVGVIWSLSSGGAIFSTANTSLSEEEEIDWRLILIPPRALTSKLYSIKLVLQTWSAAINNMASNNWSEMY